MTADDNVVIVSPTGAKSRRQEQRVIQNHKLKEDHLTDGECVTEWP